MAGEAGHAVTLSGAVQMSWWGPLVGIPFGHGEGQETCWSLVRRVYAEQLQIDLPSYGEISALDLIRVARAIGEGQLGEHWRAVSAPRPFDVAIMRNGAGGRAICHVGVMIDAERVLHVQAETDSVVVPVSHYSIAMRLAGFRRYQDV